MGFGTDDTDNKGYNSPADDELHRQIMENDAEIAQKQQALSQQRLKIIKNQGGMDWEPQQNAVPVSAAAQPQQNQFLAGAKRNPASPYNKVIDALPAEEARVAARSKLRKSGAINA